MGQRKVKTYGMAMKLVVVTGSRADHAVLEYALELLDSDPFFDLSLWNVANCGFTPIANTVQHGLRPELILLLGDRWEIMTVAFIAHLNRIPIAHIAGGDVTEGSYDDAMRDAISRMASIHFVTSTSSMARLTHMGLRNIHLVGNPCIDFMRNTPWKAERPYKRPYVVINYQPETATGVNDIEKIISSLPPGKLAVFIMPNDDLGSEGIREAIESYVSNHVADAIWHESLPHAKYLNLLQHCEEFIGNSSSMLYEAPELSIKTRMIGKRQKGRVIPWGDGHASERIIKILKYTAGTL